MEDRKSTRLALWIIACFIVITAACSSNGEKSKEEKAALQGQEAGPAVSLGSAPSEANAAQQSRSLEIAVEVDGVKLTKKELDAEIGKMMASVKDKVPADRRQQVVANMRRQLMDGFIVRTLLTNETRRLKISAAEREIDEAIEQLKGGLPPGVTVDDIMKKNSLTKEKMRDEIRFGIKVNKLVFSQKGSKAKPTDGEITEYYQKNKEKFKMPESVHVRHILVAKAAGDDEKSKAEKRAKAEDLRKQLVAGADFADIAQKNSDCPSKQSGGDLGTFTRGQMVKPFEEAAFSQEIKAIGPVVETEFGYHIIQVLERNGAKSFALDDNMKGRITAGLQQQKYQKAFEALIAKLKKKANIVVYEK